jgi:hypothetical protein
MITSNHTTNSNRTKANPRLTSKSHKMVEKQAKPVGMHDILNDILTR